ncbi:hypothetical protein SLA2020_275950 [Shorea laevis]
MWSSLNLRGPWPTFGLSLRGQHEQSLNYLVVHHGCRESSKSKKRLIAGYKAEVADLSRNLYSVEIERNSARKELNDA